MKSESCSRSLKYCVLFNLADYFCIFQHVVERHAKTCHKRPQVLKRLSGKAVWDLGKVSDTRMISLDCFQSPPFLIVPMTVVWESRTKHSMAVFPLSPASLMHVHDKYLRRKFTQPSGHCSHLDFHPPPKVQQPSKCMTYHKQMSP